MKEGEGSTAELPLIKKIAMKSLNSSRVILEVNKLSCFLVPTHHDPRGFFRYVLVTPSHIT